jgi:ATP-dependent helicase HrpB
MLTEAELLGCSASAAVLVAITQSSGFMNGSTDPVLRQERLDMFGNCGSDLIFELNAWLWAGSHQFQSEECHRYGINPGKARDIGKLAIQILQKASVKTHALPKDRLSPEESAKLRKCIFEGFSDFLAIRHRPNSPVCQMMYGRSGQLHRDSSVQDSKHMVANEIEESKTPTGIQSYLRKVTAIEPEWLTEIFTQNSKSVSYALSKDTGRFLEFIEYSVNQLTISREQNEILDHDIAAGVIAKAIMDGDISFSAWDEEMEHFVRRVNFAALNAPHYQIPAIHEEEKEFIIQQAVYKCRSLNDIQKCAVWPSLKSWLSYEQMEAVNVVAPESITLPHRKKPVRLRYDEKGDVILSETIQALYDCPLPVSVAEGKIPVIFELLAPSRRPVQITRDLEFFWKNSYLEIKKELKGRYPKHEWR